MQKLSPEHEQKSPIGKTIQDLIEQTNVPVLAHEWNGMTLKLICGNRRILTVDYTLGNLDDPEYIYKKLVEVLIAEYRENFPE